MEQYKEQYEHYIKRLEDRLERECKGRFAPDSLVEKAAHYSLMAGGKRVRGTLVLAFCDMLGGNSEVAEAFGAAIEMLHCYSLIHDDLPCMDDADTRRGKASCHKKFGEATALLAGDALLTLAFEVIAAAPEPASSVRRLASALRRQPAGEGWYMGRSWILPLSISSRRNRI